MKTWASNSLSREQPWNAANAGQLRLEPLSEASLLLYGAALGCTSALASRGWSRPLELTGWLGQPLEEVVYF